MKALLLRVGIDKGSGGTLGPLFDDGSFEYIPIPEDYPTREQRTYAQILGRTGKALAEFVRPALRDRVPHLDPEFEGFTYGDPTRTKRAQLRALDPGDLLVFYAGLEPQMMLDKAREFAIGYFTVDRIVCPTNGDLDAQTREAIATNAHLQRTTLDPNVVVVKGTTAKSCLLAKALPLGNLEHGAIADTVNGSATRDRCSARSAM